MTIMLQLPSLRCTMYFHQSLHQAIIGLMMLGDGVYNTAINIGTVKISTGMYQQ